MVSGGSVAFIGSDMNTRRYYEVIQQLDKLSTEYGFPAFGAGAYYIDSRISVFADQSHWGILIETIEVSTGGIGHYSNLNVVYRFGNYPSRPLGCHENRHFLLTSDGDDGPVFGEYKYFDHDCLNPDVRTIRIRGHIVPVPREIEVYRNKGIYLVNKGDINPSEVVRAIDRGTIMVNEDEISPRALLRALTPEFREFFFLSEEAKQTEFLYPIPQILQLEEWRHPVMSEECILEKPSHCETFQLIAKVIATCDPSEYKPTEKPNTHWSNWLEADKCF